MGAYTVTLADGRVVTVELRAPLSLDPPATDAQAREAIAGYVAGLVRPHLTTGTPPSKRVDRDPNGQIARLVELPAATADELADEVGRQIAHEMLREEAP